MKLTPKDERKLKRIFAHLRKILGIDKVYNEAK